MDIMKNIFVTGVTGFIGSHLVKYLLTQKDVKIIGLEHDFKHSLIDDFHLREKITIARGDIATVDFERIFTEYNIDTVFHLACVRTGNPSYIFQTNVTGTVRLFEACKDSKVSSIVIPIDESISNLTAYEATKRCVEFISFSYKTLPIVIAKTCSVIGRNSKLQLVSNTIRDCIAGRQLFIFEKDEIPYEHIGVIDAVRAYVALAKSIDQTKNQCYEIGSGNTMSRNEIIRHIGKVFETNLIVKMGGSGLKVSRKQMDTKNITKDTKWQCNVGMKESINSTIGEFANPSVVYCIVGSKVPESLKTENTILSDDKWKLLDAARRSLYDFIFVLEADETFSSSEKIGTYLQSADVLTCLCRTGQQTVQKPFAYRITPNLYYDGEIRGFGPKIVNSPLEVELKKDYRKIVNALYFEVFRRNADISGLNSYTTMLERNQVTVDDIREMLKHSEEFLVKQ